MTSNLSINSIKKENQEKAKVSVYSINKEEYFTNFTVHSNEMVFGILSKTMEGYECDYNYLGINVNRYTIDVNSLIYENDNIVKVIEPIKSSKYMCIECFPQETDIVYNKTKYYYFK